MKLSTGVEWSLHCCVVLSHAPGPVASGRLAELLGVSKTYLAKHLQALARAGIVRPSEGRDGGYELTRAPDEVTVLDVVQAVEGRRPAFRCTEIRQQGLLAAPPERCRSMCGIAKVMADAEEAWRASLAGVTIGDLSDRFDTGPMRDVLLEG
ncbi:Rrf2 family protein [Nocardioidaceae bacterium Broad-1]|nr:Rrf2 family protein [Nocardioidaceae bacterium Broad-1]